MKARKVKGLEPAGPLADNAERIVRVRLDEMLSFDPHDQVELHEMRIAAKRLRYVLEVTHSSFGAYASDAVKVVKGMQDLLGEIHDCDVQIPDVHALMEQLIAEDAAAMAEASIGSKDVDPAYAQEAPNRHAYAGLAALLAHLRARRRHLFGRFLAEWEGIEPFRERLVTALAERPPAEYAEAP
jgi:CHAD domain-containing protein